MGRERPPFWIEITALLVACSAVGGQPVGEHDLIEFLAQQVQQSRQRIKSVVYRYEYEAVRYVSVDGPGRSRGGGSVTLRGADRATILHRQVTANGAAQPEIESRTLLTGDFFAALPFPTNPVMKYHRTSPNVKSEPFYRLLWITAADDMLRFGFGTGDDTLQELVDDPDPAFRWRVEEQRAPAIADDAFTLGTALGLDAGHNIVHYTLDGEIEHFVFDGRDEIPKAVADELRRRQARRSLDDEREPGVERQMEDAPE